MSRKVANINIRFQLDNEDDCRAWDYLQNIDRTRFKSYTKAVVAAVNEYYERQKRMQSDPFLESREKEDTFLQRVVDTVERSLGPIVPLVTFLQGNTVPKNPSSLISASADEPDKKEMVSSFVQVFIANPLSLT